MDATRETRKPGVRARVSKWALWANPVCLVCLIALANCVALGVCVFGVANVELDADNSAKFVAILTLAVLFDEIEHSVSQFLRRLGDSRYTDISSVWTIAATLALPLGQAVIFLTIYRLYLWFRHQRSDGKPLYRQLYTAAALVLCVAIAQRAFTFVHTLNVHNGSSASSVTIALAYLLAVIVFTLVNDLLVGLAVRLSTGTRRLSDLVGDFDEKMLEVATLCLGVFVAFSADRDPLLVFFAIPLTLVLQRAALVRKLEEDASTDPKTGLLNAPTWHRVGTRELARAEREGEPVSVLIFDLDRFKDVNDTFGHLVGDQAILAMANLLKAELRDYDSVARFGGEEFVALLPKTDADAAFHVAERIRAQVLRIRLETGVEPGPRLSVSVGLACFPEFGGSMDQLLQSADTALYTAKNSGRNRVVVSTS